MSKLIIEGDDNKLAIIQRRFRNFGVCFSKVGAEAVNVEPTVKAENKGSGSPSGGQGEEKPNTLPQDVKPKRKGRKGSK